MKSAAFQFQFMVPAVHDGRDSANKICQQLQPKKTKVMLY